MERMCRFVGAEYGIIAGQGCPFTGDIEETVGFVIRFGRNTNKGNQHLET
jgi:hypothetical protein